MSPPPVGSPGSCCHAMTVYIDHSLLTARMHEGLRLPAGWCSQFGMASPLCLAALLLPISVLRLSPNPCLLHIQMYILVCEGELAREPKAYCICSF